MSASSKSVNKVVLAYSGGLDTSIILKWLQETYGAEVVTFTADLGQGEELEPARKKAEMLGIKKENIFIEDLREEFVRDYVFPMLRANALYEGVYLLGTSIARPLISKRLVEIAREQVNCPDGETGEGCGCAVMATCGIPDEDFFVVLPYNAEPVQRDLDFSTDIRVADVFFITDRHHQPIQDPAVFNELRRVLTRVLQSEEHLSTDEAVAYIE